MKFFEDQFGTLSFGMVVKFINQLLKNQTDDLKTVYPIWFDNYQKTRDTVESKRNAIISVFESGEKLKFKMGTEDTPDFYALYLPQCENSKDWGIYFNSKTCIGTLKKHPLSISKIFLEYIFAHEMVHYFTEMTLGLDEEYKHLRNHTTFCNFEEALANRLSLDTIKNTQSKMSQNLIVSLLFKKLADGGLHGYGEYDKIDSWMIATFSKIIKDGHCHNFPNIPHSTVDNDSILSKWKIFYSEKRAIVPIYMLSQ